MSIYDEPKETSIGKKNLLEEHLEKKIDYGYRQSVPSFLGFDVCYIEQSKKKEALKYFKTLKHYLKESLIEVDFMIHLLDDSNKPVYSDDDYI